jgi:hypothetical protein
MPIAAARTPIRHLFDFMMVSMLSMLSIADDVYFPVGALSAGFLWKLARPELRRYSRK